jgi:hypothetical protein
MEVSVNRGGGTESGKVVLFPGQRFGSYAVSTTLTPLINIPSHRCQTAQHRASSFSIPTTLGHGCLITSVNE